MKLFVFLKKYKKYLPVLLALIFVLVTTSGLASMYNPDELVHRVKKALEGRWEFDQYNFDYPSLPKYAMFVVGKIALALGFGEYFYVIARFLSVLLGAGVVFLTYRIARNLGGGILSSTFAALFIMSNHTTSLNARFAHNDLYLTFFLTLSFYFLLKYQSEKQRGWLYASFFSVGLAASSKFNGGVFLLVPLITFLLNERKVIFLGKLRALETLFISAVLTFLGFAVGTPKALLWMKYYFKNVLPALSRHAVFRKMEAGTPGMLGQWASFREMLGIGVYILFLIAFVYFVFKLLQKKGTLENTQRREGISLLLLSILIFDLPIMTSYNYQARFFIPLIPFFAVLSSLFLEDLQILVAKSHYKKNTYLVPLITGGVIFCSFLHIVSVNLLLKNDPRLIASEFIATLPEGTKLEYTMYPPDIPSKHFRAEYSYPIFFIKFEGQEVPKVGKGKPYDQYNEGEEGLLGRETDYFVTDSFTYARCANENVYQTNPVECAFFENLFAGKTSYEMIAEFTYSLPEFLPQISVDFVNPEIQIFQRKD